MFAVFALMCAMESTTTCREVMLPVRVQNFATCQASADRVAQDWLETQPGVLRATQMDCRVVGHTGFSFAPVADGIFAHIGQVALPSPDNLGDLANISFVIGEQGVAVIDSGGSRAVGEAAYRALRQITDLPLRYLLLGHMHPDHVYGANVFQEAGAQIVAHHKFHASLQNRARNFAQSMNHLIGEAGFLGSTAPVPDIEVQDSITLDLGGRILRVMAFDTAHTDNDLVVLDETTKTLFTSDLVFLHHTPALDGSLRGWQSALGKLSRIQARKLVPGHGPVSDWPQGMAPVQNYLSVLADSTKEFLDAGDSLSVAAPQIARSEKNKWQLFDAFNTRNATAAYVELEWE